MLPADLHELVSAVVQTWQDLDECGLEWTSQAQQCSMLLKTDASKGVELAKKLWAKSDEQLHVFPYSDVKTCWRRMYTDSSILLSVGLLLSVQTGMSDAERALRDAIRYCDLAIIVAGAPGPGRDQALQALIRCAQKLFTQDAVEPFLTRQDQSSRAPNAPYILNATREISAPAFEDVHREFKTGPFIVRGLATEWEAAKRWQDAAYLSCVAGVGRVVPVEIGSDYTKDDWTQKIVLFDHFLRHWCAEVGVDQNDKWYLAQYDLLKQFPELEQDIDIFDYVYCDLGDSLPPSSGVDYKPVANENGYLANAWIGPGGTRSPAHTDPYFNCFSQVVGSKWVWIAPPSCAKHMMAFGSGETTEDDLKKLMTNTSSVDVSQSLDDIRKTAPEFAKLVLPESQQAVLQPGDVLFLPPGWWHSLVSLDRSASVSLWF